MIWKPFIQFYEEHTGKKDWAFGVAFLRFGNVISLNIIIFKRTLEVGIKK